ncbi:MAG: AAA family ATPase [Steroidobacteraceae bacterium]
MNLAEITAADATIRGISNINLILGRNGAGKSRFLRNLDSSLAGNADFYVRYVSPERAGVFRPDGNIQNAMEQNKDWLRSIRSRNQVDNFKAASANLLREIELAYLRRLQQMHHIRIDLDRNFQTDRLDQINQLFPNISIEQDRSNYIFRSTSGDVIPPDQISSGESEAISLASEIMYFFETIDPAKFNLLLLDEPDVHLHPDLQARLANFLKRSFDDIPTDQTGAVAVCIATHSTPLVCALASYECTAIGTKDFGQSVVQMSPASEQLRKVAPFFGHPLSLSINNDVMLILEGEDDERVWQQAARSSKGQIRLFPVLATTVDQQTHLESFCGQLLSAVYDNPVAYSLRDGDGSRDSLEPIGPVVRFRLQCYAVENALLTDESLAVLGTNWTQLQTSVNQWVEQNQQHKDANLLRQLVAAPDRLRDVKIKPIRQLICVIAGSTKPWEVVLGQAIGNLVPTAEASPPTSLHSYLGQSASIALLRPKT